MSIAIKIRKKLVYFYTWLDRAFLRLSTGIQIMGILERRNSFKIRWLVEQLFCPFHTIFSNDNSLLNAYFLETITWLWNNIIPPSWSSFCSAVKKYENDVDD